MERVDVAATEADYIEFGFPDEATAERADRVVAFDAHVTGTARLVKADAFPVATAREALEAAGIAWAESEAGVTAEDMWPDEGGYVP